MRLFVGAIYRTMLIVAAMFLLPFAKSYGGQLPSLLGYQLNESFPEAVHRLVEFRGQGYNFARVLEDTNSPFKTDNRGVIVFRGRGTAAFLDRLKPTDYLLLFGENKGKINRIVRGEVFPNDQQPHVDTFFSSLQQKFKVPLELKTGNVIRWGLSKEGEIIVPRECFKNRFGQSPGETEVYLKFIAPNSQPLPKDPYNAAFFNINSNSFFEYTTTPCDIIFRLEVNGAPNNAISEYSISITDISSYYSKIFEANLAEQIQKENEAQRVKNIKAPRF